MRTGVKRALNAVAILAIALHTVLWAAAMPFAAGTATDPFSVICHSGGASADTQTPDKPGVPPSKACEHCSLCSATAAAAAPDVVLAGRLAPTRLLHRPQPASSALRPATVTAERRPRGPPQLS